MTKRDEIFAEISEEREYQRGRWGDVKDDTENTPWHWVSYIGKYATKWTRGLWAPLPPYDVDKFREMMVKVAAIAVAAIESVDRQRDTIGNAFFEEGDE